MSTRVIRKIMLVMAFLLASAIVIAPAMAQWSDGRPEPSAVTATYDISWWTIDGGGVSGSTGGGYALSGTIGQPDAGLRQSSGAYALAGGFWPFRPVTYRRIYLPLMVYQFD